MSADKISDEDVELVASVLGDAYGTAPAMPFTEYDVEQAMEAGHIDEDYTFDKGQAVIDRHVARVIVAALTGRLFPSGERQERTEWRITSRIGDRDEVWCYAPSEEKALSLLAIARDEKRWTEPKAWRRTVTEWPDGSVLTGPWVNVEEGS
jgi:hypothetical protein